MATLRPALCGVCQGPWQACRRPFGGFQRVLGKPLPSRPCRVAKGPWQACRWPLTGLPRAFGNLCRVANGLGRLVDGPLRGCQGAFGNLSRRPFAFAGFPGAFGNLAAVAKGALASLPLAFDRLCRRPFAKFQRVLGKLYRGPLATFAVAPLQGCQGALASLPLALPKGRRQRVPRAPWQPSRRRATPWSIRAPLSERPLKPHKSVGRKARIEATEG